MFRIGEQTKAHSGLELPCRRKGTGGGSTNRTAENVSPSAPVKRGVHPLTWAFVTKWVLRGKSLAAKTPTFGV